MAPLPGLWVLLLLAASSVAEDLLHEGPGDADDISNDFVLPGIYPNNKPFTTASRRFARNDEKYVQFLLFTRRNPTEPELMTSNRRRFTKFNPRLPTKVVIHGWLGNGVLWYAAQMREALLKHLDVNVVVVDWSKHGSTSKNYISASNNVEKVGQLVAQFLERLVREHKTSLDKIHLLGHSLGAHVSGVAGLELKIGKVSRITGFDPAGVFYKSETDERLKPESAKFVDVIHTCTSKLGHKMPMGHVDIYPNGGSGQPGCGQDLIGTCSHSRAYEFYEASLSNPKGFPAARCDSWDNFNKNQCDFRSINYIGEQVNKKLHGSFYLKTSDKPPFALGLSWV